MSVNLDGFFELSLSATLTPDFRKKGKKNLLTFFSNLISFRFSFTMPKD